MRALLCRASVLAILFTSVAYSQPAPAQTAPRLASPEIHDDGTVTFRFWAPKAREVRVRGFWGKIDAAMSRDEAGAWSATLGPLPMQLGGYCFVSDGVTTPDPNNGEIRRDGSAWFSLLAVTGRAFDLQAFEDAPHGSLSQVNYSPSEKQARRPLYVYLPPDYTAETRYPVLYLIHAGEAGDAAWASMDRVRVIMDNLLAAGEAAPAVVVMGFGDARQPPQSHANLDPASVLKELRLFVERYFRVNAAATTRAVATGDSWLTKVWAVYRAGSGESGAESGPGGMPTFRAASRLVEVDMNITSDAYGESATDLAAGDFTVLDGGEPRSVAFLRRNAGAETAKPLTPTPGVFSNTGYLPDATPRNITVLLYDSLNTPAQHNIQAWPKIAEYLETTASGSRIALFHLGTTLQTLAGFTGDSPALAARIRKLKFSNPLDLEDSGEPTSETELDVPADASRVERTVSALDALARDLASIRGPKSIVWVTTGVPLAAMSVQTFAGVVSPAESYETMLRAAANRLAEAGIALYIVNPRGVVAPTGPTSTLSQVTGQLTATKPAPPAPASTEYSAMTIMASLTGGRHIDFTNDFSIGLKQAVTDSRGSYTLGFYAPERQRREWRKLTLLVARSGVQLRYREGYFTQPNATQPAEWTPADWLSAASASAASLAVPLVVKVERLENGELKFGIEIASAVFHSTGPEEPQRAALQVLIAGITPGKSAQTNLDRVTSELSAKQPAQAFTLERRWKPDPGVASVRIIVRDQITGQYGAIDIPLDRIPPR